MAVHYLIVKVLLVQKVFILLIEGSFCLSFNVIVKTLRQLRSLRSLTWRRMVDMGRGLCLRFILWGEFLFRHSNFVVEIYYKMVSNIIAFCYYNCSYCSTFLGTPGFFLFDGGFNGVIVCPSTMCPRNLKHLIYLGLFTCFPSVKNDDFLLVLE